MASVLVVEDEAAIAELIAVHLRHASIEVRLAATADQAQDQIDAVSPDLVVLDWMLPGRTGIELARRWRADPRTRALPIIMLTARAAEGDMIAGLDAGADDYLTKPFSPRELLARIRAIWRRQAPEMLDQAVEIQRLRLDPATRRVTYSGKALKLGPTEFKLLHFFMTHPDRVHSREQLLDKVWGDHVFIEQRTVDVHVKRLRDALGAADGAGLIATVRGAGYRLVGQAPGGVA